MSSELPTGVVTFLMTDVESSTPLWRSSPHAAAMMARQAELIAEAVQKHAGVRPADQGEGDSTLAAFARPAAALAAALAAMRALAAERWATPGALRVRMALHSGEAELRDARNYGGVAPIRCARLRALAHGTQVLVSEATAALVAERMPEDASLIELDSVTLAGFERPERVYQLCHPDLPAAPVGLRNAPGSRLPVWPTSLVGRERERREVAEQFAEHRLVTLTGAGGSGKTRLAHAVAEDLVEHFADAVTWVELARLTSAEQVAGVVAAACGAHEIPGVAALEVLARHLAGSERLLVLDNCEHLLGACAELAEALLRTNAGVHMLATSREPLGSAGEVTWRVPSLSLPDPEERDPARIAESDAVSLFVARARAARAEFQLDAESAPLVLRICRRLDGIPLAIELAAARVRALSLPRLVDGLDDRFRLLTGGARTAVARQRTLLASVEWSHDLLDEEERTLFRRLALFATPFALEAAESVASDEDLDVLSVLDLLARLVDKSLVVHVRDRYRMLETIRQYALERADDAGELALLRDRHLAWFRRRAADWRLGSEIATPALLVELAAEAPDLIAAAEWCAARLGRLPVEILEALAQHWVAPEAFQEAFSVSNRLLGMLPVGSLEWLEALAPLASLLVIAGEVRWMAAAREALDREGDALSPIVRGSLEGALARLPALFGSSEAQSVLLSMAEVGRAAGNRLLEACATIDLAILRAQIGDPAGARPLLAWLDRHVARGSWPSPLVEMSHALVATYDGDFATGLRRLEPLLNDTPRIGPLTAAGLIGFWTCDAELLRFACDSLERLPSMGAFAGAPFLLRMQLRLLDDDLEGASRLLDLSNESLYGNYLIWSAVLRAELMLCRGDVAGVAAQIADVRTRIGGSELHVLRAETDLVEAHLARAEGSPLDAESCARAALASAVAHGMCLVQTDALEMLALLADDRGEHDHAARMLGAADAFRARSGYRWQRRYQRIAVEALRSGAQRAAFDEGAALSLAEAAEYASRGHGERGRPDFGWESLTPSETRVVELVAEGLPNAAIAKRLFVSLATVKTHLVHVYAKLGLATRAELAAAATERRLKGA